MNRIYQAQYSSILDRELHLLVYGHDGIPMLAFPCQDGYCSNWEDFDMPQPLSDFIEGGRIQLFVVDTIDRESFSDGGGDGGHRSWMQEQYYRYITEEVVPLIHSMNPTGRKILATGFSLGASHAAICFFRRPDLFGGVISLSGLYNMSYFFDGWCDERIYNNSPEIFLRNMPSDHPYIQMYNSSTIVIAVTEGCWEGDCTDSTRKMDSILREKGINAHFIYWGGDSNHDWPYWKRQIREFLPWVLDEMYARC